MDAEIDISGIELKTERLTLRPFEISDLEDLYEYAKVDGVGQAAGWKPHGDREESKTVLNMFIKGKRTFAVVYGGKVVGSVGIDRYDADRFPEFADEKCCEIGYVLSKDCWGRGLMPEAVKEVLRWLFAEKRLDAAFCGRYLWNQRSKRVQEKCGFVHYSFGRRETQLGTAEDDEVTVLTKERWLCEVG